MTNEERAQKLVGWVRLLVHAEDAVKDVTVLLDEAEQRGREEAAAECERIASIHRMRAAAFADDSDRADSEAQSDDIDRNESQAAARDYAAMRIRALKSGGGT